MVPGVPLSIDLGPRIAERLERLAGDAGARRLSDHSFPNLFLHRAVHAYRYLHGARPFVSGITYDGARHLFPLFPLEILAPSEARRFLGNHDCFYPLAAWQVARLDARHYCWQALREDSDYLYPADNFREYRGARLNRKRNLMRQLLAVGRIEACPLAGPAQVAEALGILQGWMSDKGKTAGQADEAACGEALAATEVLGLEGFLYRVDGVPAGFILTERFAAGVHVVRFAKGRDAFKGIYPYMFHHFCCRTDIEVGWLNFEQDLGLENFRQTKLSYQPSAMLEKFRVVPRCAG